MKRLILITAMLALALAGCSEDNSVGSRDLTDLEGGPAGTRLGETTAPPAPTTAAPTTAAPAGPATTQPPRTTAPPAQQQVALDIRIQPDTATTQFEPRVGRVRNGSTVKWTNTDSVPRGVAFDDNSYKSGPIPPGGSVTFKASRQGSFNYSDSTRPYAVGTLEVV